MLVKLIFRVSDEFLHFPTHRIIAIHKYFMIHVRGCGLQRVHVLLILVISLEFVIRAVVFARLGQLGWILVDPIK